MTDLHEEYRLASALTGTSATKAAGECWAKYGPEFAAMLFDIYQRDRRGGLPHPSIGTSYIDETAQLGEEVKVWHFAVVLAGVKLADHVSIGARCEIGKGSQVGERSRIGSGTFLPANSLIGANVFIGPNCTFTDDRYPVANNAGYCPEPPTIEDGASIGAGSVILPGVKIGAGARVGAGAVVTRDVLPKELVYGEPARVRKIA